MHAQIGQDHRHSERLYLFHDCTLEARRVQAGRACPHEGKHVRSEIMPSHRRHMEGQCSRKNARNTLPEKSAMLAAVGLSIGAYEAGLQNLEKLME